MRSADDIRQLFKNAELRIHPDADERMFEDVLQAQRHPMEDQPATPDSTWRKIMRNPLTKLAAAAVVVIACLIGISLWRTTASGIALGDVLAKLEQVATYTYQIHSTLTRQQKAARNDVSTVLISQDHGIKITTRTIRPDGGESPPEDVYVLPQNNSMVFIMHEQKMYVRVKFEDDTALEQREGGNNDPRIIVKQLLKCEHASLGQSVIDGIMVEGFQTTDPNYDGGLWGISDMMGKNEKVDVKLWVDVKTSLPVRLVEDIVKEHGVRVHEISGNFNWHVVASADDFVPVIPEGYTSSIREIVIPPFNEETSVKGLRAFSDIAGTYPPTLMGGAPTREYKLLTGKDKGSITIFGLEKFYEDLVTNKKDPVYYGKTVTAKDADKVLMRWKVSDNEYRVVFGDLHAETVSPEKLAELEKALPK